MRERLSAGALGETWHAHDRARERDVVVTILSAANSRPGIEQELAPALAAINDCGDPRIVHGYACERDDEQLLLVRDYVPGRELATLRAQPWRLFASAVADLAEALDALHTRGLVHGDVKTSNVIIGTDERAVLVDFYFAQLGAARSPYSSSPERLAGAAPSAADDRYAFGCLVYELLSGYPPFYPNFSPERVQKEAAIPPRCTHPAPPELIAAVMPLLAKSPDERPTALASVAALLRSIAVTTEGAPATAAATNAGAAPGAFVRPIVRVPSAASRREAEASSRTGQWLIGGAFALLAAVAISAFVLLPRLTPHPTAALPPPSTQPAAQPEAKQIDLRELAEQMDQADQVKNVYEALLASMTKSAAAEWAAAQFAAAKSAGDAARKLYDARDFVGARDGYKAALDQLQQISDLGVRTLAEQLKKGAEAITAGQTAAARQAYELALKIDPANAVATKGFKRTQTLDEVFRLLTAAGNHERDGQLPAAAGEFEAALKLDPDTTAATEGLSRVRARIAGDEFAAAVAAAQQQLRAGKLAEARAGFERAGHMRPGAREVASGLELVAQEEKAREIVAHRQQAESYEKAERWAEALAEYDAALKLDPALEFAQNARQRVVPRVELAKQLDLLVSKPDRLLTKAVREQARALLADAQKIANPGPVLRKQVDTVTASLAQFETPIRIVLQSDSQTDVVVNRVGRLGVFSSRELELAPGVYTVIGTRAGFRDVRRELTVMPGQAPPTLVVRCEEPI